MFRLIHISEREGQKSAKDRLKKMDKKKLHMKEGASKKSNSGEAGATSKIFMRDSRAKGVETKSHTQYRA